MRRLAVEITRSSVRALVVDGSTVQAAVVEPWSEQAGLPAPEAASRQAGAEALRRLAQRVGAGRAVVRSALPREQAISRLLKLPTTQPDELSHMVALAAKTQLPYPMEQAVTNFHVVEVRGGMSTVQLVAYHRDVIDAHIALLREAGLEPMVITPSAWAMLAWYRRVGRTPEVREPAVILHVDADRTDVAVVRDDRLFFSRSLDQGLHEWQGGGDAVEWLAQEVERSLSGLRKEVPGIDGASLVLTGIGELAQWKGLFEQRLGKPVIVRAAVGDLPMPAREGAGLHTASLAVVLGLALAEDDDLLNMLPPEVRQQHQRRQRARQAALTGSLVGTALMLGAGVLWAHIDRQTKLSTQLTQTVARLEAATKHTERQQRNVQAVEHSLTARRDTAAALAELFRLTLPEIQFEQVLLNGAQEELVVRGSAPTTRHVLDYLRSLEQAGTWQQVELRYSARRGARTDFELVAH